MKNPSSFQFALMTWSMVAFTIGTNENFGEVTRSHLS